MMYFAVQSINDVRCRHTKMMCFSFFFFFNLSRPLLFVVARMTVGRGNGSKPGECSAPRVWEGKVHRCVMKYCHVDFFCLRSEEPLRLDKTDVVSNRKSKVIKLVCLAIPTSVYQANVQCSSEPQSITACR